MAVLGTWRRETPNPRAHAVPSAAPGTGKEQLMDSIVRLIRVPALISLGVTLLRLIGELQNWSPRLFNREAGGGGALVGIAWLVPIFGIYFALKLSQLGAAGLRAGKMVLYALAGLVTFFVIGFGGMRLLGLDPNTPSL